MGEDKKMTGFLDLSLELRNEIYGHVLHEDEPVKIDLIRRRDGTIELARQPKRRTKVHRHEEYDQSKKVWKHTPPGRAAIIFVNHQIFGEATQILYSINRFKFDNMYDLVDAFGCLDERAKFLRYIEIEQGGYRKPTAYHTFQTLTVASNLKKLYIGHYDICSSHPERGRGKHWPGQLSVSQLIGLSTPLLKSLKASYKKQNKLFDMKEVICFELPDCTHGNPCPDAHHTFHLRQYPRKLDNSKMPYCHCSCSEIERYHAQFVSEFRAGIAKLDAEDDADAQDRPKRQLRSAKKSAVAE